MLRRAIASTLTIVTIATLSAPIAARASVLCSDDDPGVHPVARPLEFADATGQVALPVAPPTDLVIMMHGYGHTSDSWVEHMKRTAARGAIAFATDYRGSFTDEDGNVRGWDVEAGAEESIAIAQLYLEECPTIQDVIVYGVSMGGNASGMLVASGATRADGSPLVDYWVAAEPAANLLESYLEATAVEAAVPFAALVREDMERSLGGTPVDAPGTYLHHTVVLRADDIAASGVQGVAVVHGFDDGLVPYNQARELTGVLRLNGVATDMYNVARRNPDGDPDHEGGTTLSENVGDPLWAGLGLGHYPEPLAGHGTESSQTHIVIQTGLELVWDLMGGDSLPADHEFLVDGESGTQQLL